MQWAVQTCSIYPGIWVNRRVATRPSPRGHLWSCPCLEHDTSPETFLITDYLRLYSTGETFKDKTVSQESFPVEKKVRNPVNIVAPTSMAQMQFPKRVRVRGWRYGYRTRTWKVFKAGVESCKMPLKCHFVPLFVRGLKFMIAIGSQGFVNPSPGEAVFRSVVTLVNALIWWTPWSFT